MYNVFLAGGIASGKSTVAHELERLGARRIDLDQVSREVTRPHSPVLSEIAAAFGGDLVDPTTGELRRHLLAERAFRRPETTAKLERIEIPAIKEELARQLAEVSRGTYPACVVEVPLLDRAEELIPLADEVLCVVCPLAVRRTRALARGMDADDFERRVARQADDAYLRAHADTVFDNAGSGDDLLRQVRGWWDERAARGWGQH